MEERVTQKHSRQGFVEVKKRSGDGWYLLYVGGTLAAQSASLDYIMSRYDSIQ